jgi:excisionase family DNA binding protein
MPEKLFTLKEVASYLNIPDNYVERLVEEGIIPAYKIGGSFVRFRKEQIDAIINEIREDYEVLRTSDSIKVAARVKTEEGGMKDSVLDKVRDFFYFNDFYIIGAVVIAALLYVIFKM